jgi:hypothetical protein
MSKTSGLGATISVADASATPQDITNDVTNFALATPVALQDTTGVDKYAHERITLLADATCTLNWVFNAAADMSFATLSTITSGEVPRATVITPTAAEFPSLALNLLYSTYSLTRSNAGELTGSSEGSLADGTPPAWTLS